MNEHRFVTLPEQWVPAFDELAGICSGFFADSAIRKP
jgi:hypothetical protein